MNSKGQVCYRFINTILLLVLFSLSGYAQITVSHAKNAIPGQTEGIFYALPQTVLKIDFILYKTTYTRGPYAQFAERMLGVSDFIQEDKIAYQIEDVIVEKLTEPDPSAVFYIKFDERDSKEETAIPFLIQHDGVLLSAGDDFSDIISSSQTIEKTLVNSTEKMRFSYYAERNLFQRIDTLVRKITIDTTVIKLPVLHASWEDRSPEQKARAAADYIQTIREARYLLLSGYQEINYGTSIIFMDKQLQELEHAYLSLFLGLKESELEEQTIFFTPQIDDNILTLARFSEEQGIVNSSAKGEIIQLSIETAGITQAIPGIGKESLESVTVINSLLYRNPEIAQIDINFKGKTLYTARMIVPQLGVVSVAPFEKTNLNFDPKTGQLIKLIRK